MIKNLLFQLTVFGLAIGFASPMFGQGDIFWSAANLGEGVVNEDLVTTVGVGESHRLFLYWTSRGPTMSELDMGCSFEIETSESGITGFDAAETLDFDILINNEIEIGVRWGDIFGPASSVTNDQISGLFGSVGVTGNGIINSNTGPIILDQGYDPEGDAFLFATVDFTALSIGTVDFNASNSDGICASGGLAITPVAGNATIEVILRGDFNDDEMVNLLDVSAFVDLLASGKFDPAGDFNMDGVISGLDIGGFVDAIVGF